MKATIWGCRGSLAAPGPDTVRYGGNTSCVEVTLNDGTMIVLDAGTGMRACGLSKAKQPPPVVHLFLSHLHMDHLEGLGFFGPLWRPDVEFHVWGPPSPTKVLQERIARYLSPPLFPVHLSDVPSRPIFHDVPDEPWEIGDATIYAGPVSHQGPTVGYRITDGGRTLAYIPDHEPGRSGDMRDLDPAWISGFDIAADADVLLHDSQYTDDEYPEKVGWGHSSVSHVVQFAQIARVNRLMMFHHDPLHDDVMLDEHHVRAGEIWGAASGSVEMAREGMTIVLDAAARPVVRSEAG